jgi:hypothetical protein
MLDACNEIIANPDGNEFVMVRRDMENKQKVHGNASIMYSDLSIDYDPR